MLQLRTNATDDHNNHNHECNAQRLLDDDDEYKARRLLDTARAVHNDYQQFTASLFVQCFVAGLRFVRFNLDLLSVDL